MDGSVGFVAAFVAGVLSFLSPCVLPIVPGYLSFLTGLTARELAEERMDLRVVLVPSLLFVVGFSIVFVGLGASASVLGQFLSEYRALLVRAAGVVVIFFGLLMTGWIKVPWLYGEARVGMEKSRTFGRGAALVMGMAFAAGWTPCVGPILGAILALAAGTTSAGGGALLLLAYSAGLGLPFIAVALLFGRLRGLIAWIARHSSAVNRTAGVLLMAVGLLIVSGKMGVVSGWLTRVLPGVTF